MKKIYIIFCAGIMAVMSVLIGCSDDDTVTDDTLTTLKVYNIYNSGCLTNLKSGETDVITPNQHEKLRLKVLEGNHLQINHDSVFYNCGAEMEIHSTLFGSSVDGNHISVTEKNAKADILSSCTCPYNLQYEIPLDYGDYTIQLNDGKVYSFTFSATTDTTIVIGSY